jgi:serine/threonine protein kinase
LTRTPEAHKKLVEEAEMMMRFRDHPNIVQLYAFANVEPQRHEPGSVEMWMELMKESVLSRLQREGMLHEQDARPIIRDALRGLGAMHAMQPTPVIHRDIKPDNLLISMDGKTVKLADFGLSKEGLLSNTGQASLIKGTPQYVPPECYENTSLWSPSADIWAIGCVWITLCTGQPPYGISSNSFLEMAGYLSHRQRPPTVPVFLSKSATALLEMCLQWDRTKRPAATALLNNEYFSVCDEEFCPDGMETATAFETRKAVKKQQHVAAVQPQDPDTSIVHSGVCDAFLNTLVTDEWIAVTSRDGQRRDDGDTALAARADSKPPQTPPPIHCPQEAAAQPATEAAAAEHGSSTFSKNRPARDNSSSSPFLRARYVGAVGVVVVTLYLCLTWRTKRK